MDRNLHKAAINGDIATLRLLLEQGESTDSKNKDGKSPLMLASYRCQLEAVRLLLQYGSDVNAKDDESEDALKLVV